MCNCKGCLCAWKDEILALLWLQVPFDSLLCLGVLAHTSIAAHCLLPIWHSCAALGILVLWCHLLVGWVCVVQSIAWHVVLKAAAVR